MNAIALQVSVFVVVLFYVASDFLEYQDHRRRNLERPGHHHLLVVLGFIYILYCMVAAILWAMRTFF